MKPEYSLLCLQEPRPPIPILNHINPVNSLPPYVFKIHFIIILPSTSRCFRWSFSFRLFRHSLNTHFIYLSRYVSCLFVLHLIVLIGLIYGEEYKLSSSFTLLTAYFSLCFSWSQVIFSMPFSEIPSICVAP